MPKRSAFGTSRRELSEGVLFGIGTLFVVEYSSVEDRPWGCDVHRPIPQKGLSSLLSVFSPSLCVRFPTCGCREESEARLDEMDAIARERDSANTGRDVSQDALARMAIRNTQLKVSSAGKLQRALRRAVCHRVADHVTPCQMTTACLVPCHGTSDSVSA